MLYRSFAFWFVGVWGFPQKRGFGILPDKQKRRATGRGVLTANDTVLAQHGTICLCLRVASHYYYYKRKRKSAKLPGQKVKCRDLSGYDTQILLKIKTTRVIIPS